MPVRCAAPTTAVIAVRPRAAINVRSCLSPATAYCTNAKAAASPPRISKLPVRAPSSASSPSTARLFSVHWKRAAATANATDALTWNRFLDLRKTRRRLSLLCSLTAAVASTAAGVNVVLTHDIDSLGAQTFGFDPIIVIGLSTAACGCVGWLLGPTIADALFRFTYRQIGKQIVEKETQFFQRIRKFRVDPTQSSLNNPVPDFYGEKIGSVADYRRWLKDQRAFNLKTSGRPYGAAGLVALGKRAGVMSKLATASR